jgi:hypothetical protein
LEREVTLSCRCRLSTWPRAGWAPNPMVFSSLKMRWHWSCAQTSYTSPFASSGDQRNPLDWAYRSNLKMTRTQCATRAHASLSKAVIHVMVSVYLWFIHVNHSNRKFLLVVNISTVTMRASPVKQVW